MKKFTPLFFLFAFFLNIFPSGSFAQNGNLTSDKNILIHREVPGDAYLAPAATKMTSPGYRYKSSGFFTVQVNVDSEGNNILNDAANEPSIATDPTDPNKMAIGWRQFDNISSDFRQAGYGYTVNGGLTWTFPGVIDPGVFRSDPVLDYDTAGNFYYNSLTHVVINDTYPTKVFKSTNGGAEWDAGVDAKGGDKQWMTIDRSGGIGTGNIYSSWTSYFSTCQPGFFTRSIDGGASFQNCIEIPDSPYWGTQTVGPDGELYVVGSASYSGGLVVAKSTTAKNPASAVTWDFTAFVDIDGYISSGAPVNPGGLLGQANISVDCSNGPGHGNVYVLASVERISNNDHADVMFAKSTDGGLTWGLPKRINNDPGTTRYQWFGTMSVAPNGRIDVIWLDTRDAPTGSYKSALYYCYSDDQGETWSINKKLSGLFDSRIGWPQQQKMGDYYDMESDDGAAHLAWAATFNGEQDVYFSHIIPEIVGIEEAGDNPELLTVTNYPNPFRDGTSIQYQVTGNQPVRVVICNIYGEEMKVLVDKIQPAGTYTVNMDASHLPAGFYLCRLTSGSQTTTARMIRVK